MLGFGNFWADAHEWDSITPPLFHIGRGCLLCSYLFFPFDAKTNSPALRQDVADPATRSRKSDSAQNLLGPCTQATTKKAPLTTGHPPSQPANPSASRSATTGLGLRKRPSCVLEIRGSALCTGPPDPWRPPRPKMLPGLARGELGAGVGLEPW